jgi:glycerate kinase
VVVASDKFKGTLTSEEVAEAVGFGVRRVRPDAAVDAIPVADGGDGTLAAAVAAGFEFVPVTASGPTGEPVRTGFARRRGSAKPGDAGIGALSASRVPGDVAVVESADVSGLVRLPGGRLAPMTATSRGTGELIAAAIDSGCTRIILGIGGSACTDGGAGLVRALGARLYDATGEEVAEGGAALTAAASLDLTALHGRLAGVEFVVACDVDNPLTGPTGAAATYAPQKGADPAQVQELDTALAHWADLVAHARRDTPTPTPAAAEADRAANHGAATTEPAPAPHPSAATAGADAVPHPGAVAAGAAPAPHPSAATAGADAVPHPGAVAAGAAPAPHRSAATAGADAVPHPGAVAAGAAPAPHRSAATAGADPRHLPGAGAAGGVGFAALALLGAELRPGIELMLELVGFHEQLAGADLVITGEGALDEQTLHGKAAVGVAAAARAAGIPVVAVCGTNRLDPARLRQAGIVAAYALTDLEPDVRRCIADPVPLLRQLGERIAAGHLPRSTMTATERGIA